MKNKPYSVTGDKDNGFRIAVRTDTGVKAGDRYDFMQMKYTERIRLPAGTLVYVPAPRPVCKREKKVSGWDTDLEALEGLRDDAAERIP